MSIGGGAIWTIVAATAAGVAAQAARAAAQDQELADTASDGSPYRPAQWQDAPLVTITVPGNDPASVDVLLVNGSSAALNAGGGESCGSRDPNVPGGFKLSASTGTTQIVEDTIYVFDAVIRTEHQRRIEKTQHPIQTGANVADHAIIEPARVVLEIGMSDAMDSYTPGQWTGDSSKSVNAYQTLVSLRMPQPLTVTTRLNVYTNMILTSVSAPDTVETKFGLKSFPRVRGAIHGHDYQPASQRAAGSDGRNEPGNEAPLPVPASILQQNVTTQTTTVPVAGVLSSNPITGGQG